MQIERAIKHFHYKLANVWNSTEPDIKAFNSIRDYFTLKNKEQINNNLLFAKLYIYTYSQFLEKFNATVFDDIPQKELNKMLSMDLEAFIDAFTNKLNQSDLYEVIERLGLSKGHPATRNDIETNSDRAKIKNMSKENIELISNPAWNSEDVGNNLIAMINAVLNSIK